MPRDDAVYLQHILDAIACIETYLYDVDEDRFNATPLLQDGVIRQLEIIGEATKQLSVPLINTHPRVPWRDLARMRDKLIHQYFGVDIATEDLPTLKAAVEQVIKSL